MRILLYLIAALVLFVFLTDGVFAQVTAPGGDLPVASPLVEIMSGLTGPVSFSIALIAMFVAGGFLVFGGGMSEWARRMAVIALAFALMINAANMFSAIFTPELLQSPGEISQAPTVEGVQSEPGPDYAVDEQGGSRVVFALIMGLVLCGLFYLRNLLQRAAAQAKTHNDKKKLEHANHDDENLVKTKANLKRLYAYNNSKYGDFIPVVVKRFIHLHHLYDEYPEFSYSRSKFYYSLLPTVLDVFDVYTATIDHDQDVLDHKDSTIEMLDEALTDIENTFKKMKKSKLMGLLDLLRTLSR